eukprot:CAMPEP_0116024104 /NCGR_PEP_ID=MMETSP0321-20121206/12090_1 /TAXON_ID=163516 /ORGANISM="Leptocylindrus danicus var. danicus, Strain B650" /LENGTH=67 /DNA_ID=CAMNT_0003495715 /DNA_START=658 /DNA_END=861 /DNA_ORIENTATION=+
MSENRNEEGMIADRSDCFSNLSVSCAYTFLKSTYDGVILRQLLQEWAAALYPGLTYLAQYTVVPWTA